MATAEQMRAPLEQPVEKGLKRGALGLVSTTVIATASVAPAYSIAAEAEAAADFYASTFKDAEPT
jgi:hypothetical protein